LYKLKKKNMAISWKKKNNILQSCHHQLKLNDVILEVNKIVGW